MHAQIPVETDDEPQIDNPVMGEDDSLYSIGPADTSSDLKYYIQPINEITIQEKPAADPICKAEPQYHHS